MYSGFVIILAFFVGWLVTSSQIKRWCFCFQSSPSKGLIFLGIAIANFIAMFLAKGKANIALEYSDL